MKPTTPKRSDLLRKLNNQYRVVFIDDESMEEAASFKLTMGRLYVYLSTMFVAIVLITVCILLLSPLKYYIPGYGNNATHNSLVKMKQQVDSLNDLVAAQEKFEDNLRNVISGNFKGIKDTALLDKKLMLDAQVNATVPQVSAIKPQAIKEVQQENKRKQQEEENQQQGQ